MSAESNVSKKIVVKRKKNSQKKHNKQHAPLPLVDAPDIVVLDQEVSAENTNLSWKTWRDQIPPQPHDE